MPLLARVPTAPRFAEEIERTAAASDVTNMPAVMNEWSAIEIEGVETAQKSFVCYRQGIISSQ